MQDTAPRSKKRATYADIEALPPNMVGEILFETLCAHPGPAPRHSHAAGELTIELGPPFGRGRGGPGGWRFHPQPELHFGPHAVVPDIGGWRIERLPQLPSTAYFEAPPDRIAEIHSPSTRRTGRTGKVQNYAGFGFGHAWYVDPIDRTLEVFYTRGRPMADCGNF